MRIQWLKSMAAMAGLLLISQATTRADVIYDNLGVLNAGSDSVASIFPRTGGPLSDSFSSGITGGLLTSIDLKMFAAIPSDGGTFSIALLSNSPGTPDNPGSVLTSIATSVADSSLTTSLTDQHFNLSTPFLLAANTRYWVQLTQDSGSAQWGYAVDDSGFGVGSELFSNSAGTFTNNQSPSAYQMRVSTTVPEPSSVILAGMGVMGIGLRQMLRGRRKQTN